MGRLKGIEPYHAACPFSLRERNPAQCYIFSPPIMVYDSGKDTKVNSSSDGVESVDPPWPLITLFYFILGGIRPGHHRT